MKKRTVTKAAALLVSAGMLVSLAACEGQVPQATSSQSSEQSSPDLTTTQEHAIRNKILDAIDAADAAQSADGLSERVTGPQLDIRSSERTAFPATSGSTRTSFVSSRRQSRTFSSVTFFMLMQYASSMAG